jgi:hypothetical protein
MCRKRYLDKESEHCQAEMRVGVVEIFDDALGPLETLLAKRASAVE